MGNTSPIQFNVEHENDTDMLRIVSPVNRNKSGKYKFPMSPEGSLVKRIDNELEAASVFKSS